MPYIKKHDRILLDAEEIVPTLPGELNYLITEMCRKYLAREGSSYDTLNQIVGILECAKLEFYRRIAAPYEDQKIKENGDVYDI